MALRQAKKLHAEWWHQRVAQQKEIDASIAAKADFEYLYDKPYDDKRKVRVAGPFTVESLSPHRVLAVDENDELIDSSKAKDGDERDFIRMILENLKTAGVQQAHKEDKIAFSSITPWPGNRSAPKGDMQRARWRSALPSSRLARSSGRQRVAPRSGSRRTRGWRRGLRRWLACAFNYDAHSAEFDKLGRIPVLKARMNADLHMADDLKNTGKGNLFVIFGEPDIEIRDAAARLPARFRCKVTRCRKSCSSYPNTEFEVRSDGPEGIA